ncbi:hypothetical protein B0O44_11242 [Pedobacter nutrimenti]|uniref:Uncharacterized protein n=1 Tax=Pedobacter nutrimenti TaxID=1241337 RepID=A0A318U5Z2_9SPHI|nr:hypothetical protein B0O44_11242 [Pedobacter nutrimenti]
MNPKTTKIRTIKCVLYPSIIWDIKNLWDDITLFIPKLNFSIVESKKPDQFCVHETSIIISKSANLDLSVLN